MSHFLGPPTFLVQETCNVLGIGVNTKSSLQDEEVCPQLTRVLGNVQASRSARGAARPRAASAEHASWSGEHLSWLSASLFTGEDAPWGAVTWCS